MRAAAAAAVAGAAVAAAGALVALVQLSAEPHACCHSINLLLLLLASHSCLMPAAVGLSRFRHILSQHTPA
jgi:hypothetical protein|eukprot:SAG25_NODE_309_length_10042_cov_25.194609_5_plen_71_part_00